jgi:hypothetical protein
MSSRPNIQTRVLWIGVAVFVAGRLIDLWWHATHPEFETAADQVRAHFVVWTGTILMLVGAAWAVAFGAASRGYLVVLAGGVGYAAVAVWHFWEHSQGRDPDLPHLLLLITNVVMFLGAAWVWLEARKRVQKPIQDGA